MIPFHPMFVFIVCEKLEPGPFCPCTGDLTFRLLYTGTQLVLENEKKLDFVKISKRDCCRAPPRQKVAAATTEAHKFADNCATNQKEIEEYVTYLVYSNARKIRFFIAYRFAWFYWH